MKITAKPCTMLVVDDLLQLPHRVDPVRIITENFEPGKGRIILVCYDAAWVGYWGSMGGSTVEEFFMRCDSDYLAGNMMCASGLRSGPEHRSYLNRVIKAAQEALRSRVPKPSKTRIERIERVKHVNQLIKVISDHGRRFFWNQKDQRVARMEIDAKGKLWWIDDYRGSRVCVEKVGGYEHRWQGFSHGGTLMQLAQQMRDYVKTGKRIPLWYICQPRIDQSKCDIWGYGASAEACRNEAKSLPIISA